MRTLVSALLVTTATLLPSASRATDLQCLLSASGAFRTCNTGCKSDFTNARAACATVDPGCLSECNATLTTCIDGAKASLQACLTDNACDAIVGQFGDGGGRDVCKAQVGCGAAGDSCDFNHDFVLCLDPYEQRAFVCRNGCQDAWQLSGGPAAVAACRKQLKTCLEGCPPPPQ
jgi:hypothetical protein